MIIRRKENVSIARTYWQKSSGAVVNSDDMRYFVSIQLLCIFRVSVVADIQSGQNLGR